jgi:hypothetical protein
MLDAQLLTLDGGNYSDMKAITLRMREVRYLTSQVTLMLRTETSLFTEHMEESTNNGM